MIQIHEEPTDYVWISCAPPDPENEWCYGGMRRKPTRDADELNNASQPDIADDAMVPMVGSPNGAAGTVEPAEMTWKHLSELALKILRDYEQNPEIGFSAKSLELARGVLKCKAVQQDKSVQNPHSGDHDTSIAGPSTTGLELEDSTQEKATDNPETPPRKRARTNCNESTSITNPAQDTGKR